MKHKCLTLLLAVTLALLPGLPVSAFSASKSAQTRAAQEEAALAVVARRNEAVNANDIDGFLAAYHVDFAIYEYPDHLLGRGTDRMRDIFGPIFAGGNATVTVHRQMVLQNTVVSEETLSLNGIAEDLISIYTVEDAKITQVRLIELTE